MQVNSFPCHATEIRLSFIFLTDYLVKDVFRFVQKGVSGKNEIEGVNNLENIWQYNWNIDTKYYTADIQLCCTTERTIGNKEFAESVQAVIIYFNSEKESSFDEAKSWLPYVNELTPPIQILVCQSCSEDNDVRRSTIQKWCIENEFELVELAPQQENEEEDDFAETTGIKRIVQALHAHTWSNLIMKENPSIYSPYMRKLMEEERTGDQEPVEEDNDQTELGACGDCNRLNDEENNLEKSESEKPNDVKNKQKESNSSKIDSLLQNDDMAMFDAVGEDDPGGSFESLFAKFSLMKDKAESLPPEQRKAYAEKVAVSFWKALGGDEEEIDGLSFSSDDDAN